MNNMKFIARYAATAALIAGVSSQVAAFQGNCTVDFFCDPGELAGQSEVFSDTIGPVLAPFGNQNLTLPKFHPQTYADLHGVAASDITLKAVRLTLRTTILDADVEYNNQNTNEGCTFTWTYNISTGIQANPPLGIDNDLVVTVLLGEGPIVMPIGPSQYTFDLLTDGSPPGPVSDETCLVSTTNLGPWIGAAAGETVQFDALSQAIDNDDSQCGGVTKIYTNLVEEFVSVEYFYCYTSDILESECACETPSPHYRQPGSLLLFPEFDNREGDVSIVTVTNTDCTGAAGGQDVDIEFVYIDGDNCSEFNKTDTLTPCDTISILTNFHNPNDEQGYLYVFAKNEAGEPIVWNHLIGSLLIVSGLEAFDYGLNPVVFRGIGSAGGSIQPNGTLTDLDGDGNRDLDAREYEPAPDTITIPRFLGQDAPGNGPGIRSQMILVALTGGVQFETNVCFLFWNDNEQQFSGEYNFTCWDKPYLDDMTLGFRNAFLKTTDHDPLEIIGAPQRESGWICLQGCLATSSQETIIDPAIYAVLVERIGSYGVADLPFECGFRINGSLLPNSVFGDGDPNAEDGDNQ